VRTQLILSFASLVLLAACDGGPLPLEVEAHEATTPGNTDKIEVIVKTATGVDVTVDGKTENTGEVPNHTFLVPKSHLKLGQNMIAVGAFRKNLGSTSAATQNAKLDVGPIMVLHVQGADGAPNEGTFTCPGAMCAATAIPYAKSGKMALSVMSDIKAKLTIEGKSIDLAAGAKTPIDVDLIAKLGSTQVGQNEDAVFPLTLEADGAKLTENLSLRGNGMIEIAKGLLAKAASGPVLFPGEAASNDPPDEIVVLGAPSAPIIATGKGKTFADVDLIGLGTQSERKFPCPNGTILYIDLDVKVVNRRTGASVGQKTISADRTSCPPTPTTQPLKSVVREDDIKKVMADMFLKK